MAHPFPACQVAARCLRGARERAPDGGARDRAQGRAGGPRGRRGRRRRRGRRVPVRARLDHGPGLGQRLQPGLVLAGARAGEHHVRAPPAQRACAVRNEAGHRLGVLACSRYLPILRMGCTASCERGSAARLMPGLGSTACAWIAGMLCGRACCRQPGLWRWWQRRCSVGQPSCGGVNSLARARAKYVPGPVLRAGKNEVILLEVEHAPEDATGARPLSMHAPSPSMPACLRVSRKHKLTLSLPGPLHTCLTGESSVQAIYRHGEQAGTGASVWARV